MGYRHSLGRFYLERDLIGLVQPFRVYIRWTIVRLMVVLTDFLECSLLLRKATTGWAKDLSQILICDFTYSDIASTRIGDRVIEKRKSS